MNSVPEEVDTEEAFNLESTGNPVNRQEQEFKQHISRRTLGKHNNYEMRTTLNSL